MKGKKSVYYQCPKCKTEYTPETVTMDEVPFKAKKDKQGKIVEVLEFRKVATCEICNSRLLRRVEK